MAIIVKHRRGLTSDWYTSDITPYKGEILLEELQQCECEDSSTSTGICNDCQKWVDIAEDSVGKIRIKVGNGTSKYSELSYVDEYVENLLSGKLADLSKQTLDNLTEVRSSIENLDKKTADSITRLDTIISSLSDTVGTNAATNEAAHGEIRSSIESINKTLETNYLTAKESNRITTNLDSRLVEAETYISNKCGKLQDDLKITVPFGNITQEQIDEEFGNVLVEGNTSIEELLRNLLTVEKTPEQQTPSVTMSLWLGDEQVDGGTTSVEVGTSYDLPDVKLEIDCGHYPYGSYAPAELMNVFRLNNENKVYVSYKSNNSSVDIQEPGNGDKPEYAYCLSNNSDDGEVSTAWKKLFTEYVNEGGTVVLVGKGYFSGEVTLPSTDAPVTFTAKEFGTDYMSRTDEGDIDTNKLTGECGMFIIGGQATNIVIYGDIILDNTVLLDRVVGTADSHSIHIKEGGSLIIKDTVKVVQTGNIIDVDIAEGASLYIDQDNLPNFGFWGGGTIILSEKLRGVDGVDSARFYDNAACGFYGTVLDVRDNNFFESNAQYDFKSPAEGTGITYELQKVTIGGTSILTDDITHSVKNNNITICHSQSAEVQEGCNTYDYTCNVDFYGTYDATLGNDNYGWIPLNNLNEICSDKKLRIQVPEPEKRVTTKTYTVNGYYSGCIYGTITAKSTAKSTPESSEDMVEWLKSAHHLQQAYTSGLTFNFDVPSNTESIIIACPVCFKFHEDQDCDCSSGIDVLNTTVNAPMPMTVFSSEGVKLYTTDTDSSGGMDYKVWVYTPAEPYTQSANLKVTLK